jgi:hypothetical protein
VISWPRKPFFDPFPKELNGQLTASASFAGIELDAVVKIPPALTRRIIGDRQNRDRTVGVLRVDGEVESQT